MLRKRSLVAACDQRGGRCSLLGERRKPLPSLWLVRNPERVWFASTTGFRSQAHRRFATVTDAPDYASMTTAQLKEVLRERKLKMSGSKSDMLLRLGCAPHPGPHTVAVPSSGEPRPDRPNLRVIVAENMAVAQAIAKALGVKEQRSGYIGEVELGSGGTVFFPGNATAGDYTAITWTSGQLLDWKEDSFSWSLDKLPVLPARFELTYSRDPTLRKQFETIRRLMRHATEIVNACNAGREGELAFRMIQEKAAPPPEAEYTRLWISSLTEEAIKDGFQNLQPASAFDALYASALARKEADWFIGMNATQIYTMVYKQKIEELGDDKVVSVGRVQTPALKMVVDRAAAVNNFVKEPYWKLCIQCLGHNEDEEFYLEYYDPDTPGQSGERIGSYEDVERLLAELGSECRVHYFSQKESFDKAPKLYDLTALQKDANRWHNITAQQTLQALTKLYETHKFITNPRTSSRHLPPGYFKRISLTLRILSDHEAFGDAYQQIKSPDNQKRFSPANKAIFDAERAKFHHAILPTLPLPSPETVSEVLSPTELEIYEMLIARLFASFMQDCKKLDTEMVVVNNDNHYFRGKTTTVVHPGWKVMYRYLAHRDESDGEDQSSGDAFDDDRLLNETYDEVEQDPDIDAQLFSTKFPVFNNEQPMKGDTFQCKLPPATLSCTTRPPTYLTEAALLHLMETAGQLASSDEESETLREYGLGTAASRASAIERLVEVGYIEREGKYMKPTKKGAALGELLGKSVISEPQATGKWEKRLHEIWKAKERREDFLRDIKEHTRNIVENAKDGGRSLPDLPKMRRKFASKKFLEGAAQEATKMFEDKEEVEDLGSSCWKCKTGRVITRPQWKSWRCDNKDAKCDFTLYKNSCGRPLEKNELAQLLEEGVTAVLTGFTSKAGKRFNARLALNEKNQVVFMFPDSRFSSDRESQAE